jgi:predicted 3-demethylubiquinone-9 3-methyltransferase (glyoxalase superfamily)
MPAIIPHLWFDKGAKEAAAFYVDAFKRGSRVVSSTTLHDTPSGDADTVEFELAGHRFMAISAGPYFKINPSISFFVNFDPSTDPQAREHLDELWSILADGGKALMPLQEYPFSKRYGWIQDKFGVSWQLILTDPTGEPRPFIVPSLLFVGDVCGKADEAVDFYVGTFPGSRRGITARYPAGMAPDKEGSVMFADCNLSGTWFAAMDSAHKHEFAFGEAISLLVECKDQAEIDAYWEKLSTVPAAEQCGWCKDQFGVSWQIAPASMQEMLKNGTPEQVGRLTKAFLAMKKFDLAKLEEAYRG